MKKSYQKSASKIDTGAALHEATRKGDVDAVKRILETDPDCVNRRQRHRTPLHNAAVCGFCDIVRTLLEYGATIDARSYSGYTPLIFAAEDDHPDVLATLLKAGADINAQTSANDSHHPLYTALHKAASLESCDVLHLLVATGASVNKTAEKNVTALHIAVKRGLWSNTLILCAFGCDPLLKDSEGKTAFEYATELDRPLRDKIRDIMTVWSSEQDKLSWLRTKLVKFVDRNGKIDTKLLLVRWPVVDSVPKSKNHN